MPLFEVFIDNPILMIITILTLLSFFTTGKMVRNHKNEDIKGWIFIIVAGSVFYLSGAIMLFPPLIGIICWALSELNYKSYTILVLTLVVTHIILPLVFGEAPVITADRGTVRGIEDYIGLYSVSLVYALIPYAVILIPKILRNRISNTDNTEDS